MRYYKFECLCCEKEVEVDSLQKIQASEHLCRPCREANPKEYLLTLALRKLIKQGD